MPHKTWRQRVEAYLVAQGLIKIETNLRSRRYVAYGLPNEQATYFLGKAGAVLYSPNRHITYSHSVTAVMHKRVELWEREVTNG